MTSFSIKIINIQIQPTSSCSIKLRSGFHGLASLLGELILEPFLLSSCCFTDLLELSLEVNNLLLLL
jgi:hypothetical protein